MKKILMTWYGITDFRASLGLEHTTGPILGALLAGDYTDVIILGFTNPDAPENESDAFQQKKVALGNADPATARQFLNLFSNTVEAHNHFVQWLERQLLDAEKKIEVCFRPVALKHLNDTEGIYEAANQSLSAVSAAEGEKLVTLFLSPGTPVMAFVWAFAALRHPKLKKRLIASSQPEKPPEQIILPNEWLEWHGRQVRANTTDPEQYDVIFHLFGEQRMPSLLGILQFSSRKHIFVNSRQFPAEVMKQFIGDAEFGEIGVDPYDPENVRTTLLSLIEKMQPYNCVGFNLTGGTKLMYAGALAACRKVNATPFYFNGRNNKVIFLNDFKSIKTKEIESVETFIKINADHLLVSKKGNWDEIKGIHLPGRRELTSELWKNRTIISKLYKDLSEHASKYTDNPRPFSFSKGKIIVSLSSSFQARISINGKAFEFAQWPDFARYLCGGWLEEYTFMRLKPLADEGLIKDLRIGLEVSFIDKSNEKGSLKEQLLGISGNTYQELDVVFTDGRRLYVVECKAGYVMSEYVMKLQNIVRYFGGVEGRGILVSCFEPSHSVVRKKIDDANNIKAVLANKLFDHLKSTIE